MVGITRSEQGLAHDGELASVTALGLMSGTSLDGIDAAVIRTDGERVEELGPALTVPYDGAFRERLRDVLKDVADDRIPAVSRELTLLHAEAVRRLLGLAGWSASRVDVIGFHGHTVFHRPEDGTTRQIGDGALLARETGLPVVVDFRGQDMALGGQGAPLAPLYHAALAASLEKPVAVLNIGRVANVTWIGRGGEILAFDTGPGNALIDDWTRITTGQGMDQGGSLAASGRVDERCLDRLLEHAYFFERPPKSLDRDDFRSDLLGHLSPADGAATLVAFTAGAVVAALEFLPERPRRWLVCGGGRHNPTLMRALKQRLEPPVESVEAVGWQGDALEAQAFGFLAVRSLRGLPLSLPTTTGVAAATTGGTLHLPSAK